METDPSSRTGTRPAPGEETPEGTEPFTASPHGVGRRIPLNAFPARDVSPPMENRNGPDDLALLRGIADGCEESFRLLFRRWGPRLGRFLERAGGSRETGEDLLQEAFVRVIRAAGSFEPRGSVGAWLHRICANLAYSHWRRETRSPFVDVGPDPVPESIAPPRA
ncbi:MAG: hypothetical protein GF328_13435, partial [Candidatus Latescibacteria bacterium]|nr:hypothetical protein [Candidatus Latescibacterota bacterium]